MQIKNFIFVTCLFFIGISKVFSSTSQYIYSFTDNFTYLSIDITTGQLVINDTLSMGYNTELVVKNDVSTGVMTLLADYLSLSGTQYVLIDFNYLTNTFSNTTANISISTETSSVVQQIASVGNNVFYLPTLLGEEPEIGQLQIIEWDFNKLETSFIYFEAEGFNAANLTVATYNAVNNKYYIMYFDFYYNTLIKEIPVPLISLDNSNVQTYNFSKETGVAFNENTGQLFSTPGSSSVYFIQNYPTNITIFEIDFTTLKSTKVFSTSIGYTQYFIPYFFSQNNEYLVVLYGGQTPTDSILYTFVDLNSFKVAHTFTSPNYFTTRADWGDLTFTFNGSF